MWFYLLYIVRIEIEVEFLNWLSNFFEIGFCVYKCEEVLLELSGENYF